MSQSELLKLVIQVLESAGIPYMLTGSVVSSLQGEPRSTYDLDVVVSIRKSNVRKLVDAFPLPGYYLDEDSVVDAIEHGSNFNLIDTNQGQKVDFWLLTDEPFDRSRFSRRYAEHALDLEMQVSSPEDTILAKLRWSKLCGGSEKQFTDALRVYEVQSGKLDLDYLELWAKELAVGPLWKRLLETAETP